MFLFTTDAVPSEKEAEFYDEVADILNSSHDIIAELQQYKGAAKEIKEVSHF